MIDARGGTLPPTIAAVEALGGNKESFGVAFHADGDAVNRDDAPMDSDASRGATLVRSGSVTFNTIGAIIITNVQH
jgi:hypothetical protein